MRILYEKKLFVRCLFYKCFSSTFLVLFCLLSSQSYGQSITITGKVKDQMGIELPGVGVTIKNTTIGTSTNLNGDFTIKVPNTQSILVFKFLGFETKEVPVGNTATPISIVLNESVNSLNEVVVVGFGEQKKSTITGAIGTVSGKEILQSPTYTRFMKGFILN